MHQTNIENIFGALAIGIADEVRVRVEPHGVVGGASAAALALIGQENGMAIETLADALVLSHSGAVRLVDRLIGAGLVEKKKSTIDRRSVALSVSAKGAAALPGLFDARRMSLRRALSALTAEERRQFGKLSSKIVAGMVRDLSHAYRVCSLCEDAACRECPVEEALDSRP